MLYFEMLVENSNLLNILLPNDNKVLKEALKEADSKTLEQLVKNNTGSVNDVLKDLFDNLKNGTKSNTAIENVLKNSTVFKEMGNFSNSLSSMLESLTTQDKNPTLEKFKPILENFLKNIKDMDANTLKEQLKNSGVFLESKMAQGSNPNLKIENILNQVQNLIKDLNTPQAKQVNELISKLIQSPNSNDFTTNLKTLTNSLEKLNNSIQSPQTQNISTSLNQLKNILNEASLTESKISNNAVINTNTKENINLQTKELLTQIKNEIVQNPVLQTNKSIMPILENLLKMDNLFAKNEGLINQPILSNISTFTSNFSSNITSLLTNLKDTFENLEPNNTHLQNQISKFIEKIEDIIKELSNPTTHKNQAQNLDEDMKSILLKMQDELASKTDVKSQELSKQVDKLLTQIDYQQLLSLSSNSNSVYIPFLWDMLEDGNISMKKADEDKFYCQINLTLKDFGKVDLMLALYDKNKLDLTVYAQREHFKTAIRDNMQQLKIALNSVDLIPVNVKLLDLKEENKSEDKPTQAYINNSYNQNINLSSKIDIRA